MNYLRTKAAKWNYSEVEKEIKFLVYLRKKRILLFLRGRKQIYFVVLVVHNKMVRYYGEEGSVSEKWKQRGRKEAAETSYAPVIV